MFVPLCSIPSFPSSLRPPRTEPSAFGSPPPTVPRRPSTTVWSVPGPWLLPRKPTCSPLASMRDASASSSVATTPSPRWMPPARSYGQPTTTSRRPPSAALPADLAMTTMPSLMESAFLSFPATWVPASCTPRCSSTTATAASLPCAATVSSSSTPPRPSVTRPSARRSTLSGLDRAPVTMPSASPPRRSRCSRTSRRPRSSDRRRRRRRACSVGRWSASRAAIRPSYFTIGSPEISFERSTYAPRRCTGPMPATWCSWRARIPHMSSATMRR
mmetsp:Transcript_27458/g.79147  ORF Transcript_27458/g.79147 Transcript_27458/m.79147 type:complete len:273 (+) Transcript_27458:762-1580(+)